MIAALDFGITTGWATSTGLSGTWDLSIRKDESSGMRLIRFEDKLRTLVRSGASVVVFEAISARQGKNTNQNAITLHVKLQAILERLAVEMGFEHKSYNNQSIKKRAGARNKAEIMAAAEKVFPKQHITDDNQADALWCLQLALEEFDGTEAANSKGS